MGLDGGSNRTDRSRLVTLDVEMPDMDGLSALCATS